jgi:hypothetical protein
MDTFQCTEKELNKILSNSTLVKLHPPLGGTILTRVFKRPNGEYTSVFERTTTEPAPPPLEHAAAFSAEPLTAPALTPQHPPTAPPAASPTGFWPPTAQYRSATEENGPRAVPRSVCVWSVCVWGLSFLAVFIDVFLTMKIDGSIDCAGSCRSRFRIELCFYFILGPQNSKMHFKNSDFGWVKI